MMSALPSVPFLAPAPKRPNILHDVRLGLVLSRPRRLPGRLLYDDEGRRLLERLATAPEDGAARTERALLQKHADELATLTARAPVRNVEKPGALTAAALHALRPEEALAELKRTGARRMALCLGSWLGSLDEDDAVEVLRGLRATLPRGGALLLGLDRVKDLRVLLQARDDAQGITAALNKGALVRINQELGGHFELEAFAHRVRWNGAVPAVELHLESLANQRVRIDALGTTITFARGETIHTETSVKFDEGHADRLLARAKWIRERTFLDDRRTYALHLCRAI